MVRCGCGRAVCSCVIVGSGLVEVTGSGTQANPYIVDVDPEEVTDIYGRGISVMDPRFGAVGDGVTDDGLAIQAALDFAYAAGGDTVYLPNKIFAWSGDLVVRGGCYLEGFVSNAGTGSTLKALDATSRLMVGRWADVGSASHYVGGVSRFRIDGDSTGKADGLLRFQCVGAKVDNVKLVDAGSDGVIFDAAQNMEISSLDVDSCGGTGLGFTNGSGGLQFTRSEIRSNQRGIRVWDDDASVGNAYPFGSTHINFTQSIIETYVNCESLVYADAGSMIRFDHCGFSVNAGSTVTEGACVVVADASFPGQSTYVEIVSPLFNGGAATNYPAVRMIGNNVVRVSGECYLQDHSKAFLQDTGVGILRMDASVILGPGATEANLFGAINGGSTVSYTVDKYLGDTFHVQPGLTWAAWRNIGDVGLRGYMNASQIAWGDGTGFSALAALSFDGVGLLAAGRLKLSNGFTRKPGNAVPIAVTVAGTDVPLDVRAASLYRVSISGVGTISSMEFNNPEVGAVLTLLVQADAGTQPSIVWPVNAKFAQDSTPKLPSDGSWLALTFIYESSTGKWVEQTRNVPVGLPRRLRGANLLKPNINFPTATTNIIIVNQEKIYVPWDVFEVITIDRWAVLMVIKGVGGTQNAKIGLYIADPVTNYPVGPELGLAAVAGTIDLTAGSAGALNQSATFGAPFTIQPGQYWIAVYETVTTPTTTATLDYALAMDPRVAGTGNPQPTYGSALHEAAAAGPSGAVGTLGNPLWGIMTWFRQTS